MTMLSKLQSLEDSIKAFFSHAENVSKDLNELKNVLGVAEEVVAVVAPTSGVAEAVGVANEVVNAVESVIPAATPLNP